MKLLKDALIKFTAGLLMVGALIFLPAGTLSYGRGWLLIGLLFAPMLIAGFFMFFKSPEFLAKRLDVKEKQATQKGAIAFSGLMFLAGFAVAGLDFSIRLVSCARLGGCYSICAVFTGLRTVRRGDAGKCVS